MKRSLFFIFYLCWFPSVFAQYSVKGGTGIPYPAENDTRNRIEVYLLNGLSGAEISFSSSEQVTHQWYKYRDKAEDAIPVVSVQNGNTSSISDIQDGYGYFVSLSPDQFPRYVWIIDYSRYIPQFFSFEIMEEEDKCQYLKLIADIEAEALYYHTPAGARMELRRTFLLKYTTQKWMDDNLTFVSEPVDRELNLISEIVIDAPLENTTFTLSGDKFAEHFDVSKSIQTQLYEAIAIDVHGDFHTNKEHADNEVHNTTGNILGGSAPIEYTFTAYANEPVATFYIWTVKLIDELTGEQTTKFRDTNKMIRCNFENEGNYIVQLEVSDRNSICVIDTTIFNVNIGKTFLKIPDAFSPGSSIGINDELKISFTSITSFKASIYNRLGILLYQWSDPTKGWDGRVHGKFVPTGAYFIVVEYQDSYGKKHTESKAIHVLRAKN